MLERAQDRCTGASSRESDNDPYQSDYGAKPPSHCDGIRTATLRLLETNVLKMWSFNPFKIWIRQFGERASARLRRFFARWFRKIIDLMLSDLELMGALHDATSSAQFAKQHLRDVPELRSRDDLYRAVLALVPSDEGLFLEFGVYKGASINVLAGIKPHVTFYGFDSFHGLPESWSLNTKKGAFSVAGMLPPVRDNVALVQGFFEETLDAFLTQHSDQSISFIHVDCDLYSSTKTILALAGERLKPGSLIVFDEYFNYPGWQEHEYKAFLEFVAETKRTFEYVGYVRNDRQVAVRLL